MRAISERSERRGFAAFTITELLVAIAIVGVLAAITFSASRHIQESGRQTTCLNNSRQIAFAIRLYVQDNDESYPPTLSVENKEGVSVATAWQQLIHPYIKDTRVFHCPDQEQDSSDSTGLSSVDYTYNYRRLNTFSRRLPSGDISGVHEERIATPSRIWVTVDRSSVTPDGIYKNARLITKTSCGRSFAGSTLHAGGGNYSFVDGHVKWLTPESMGETECLNGPLPDPFRD